MTPIFSQHKWLIEITYGRIDPEDDSTGHSIEIRALDNVNIFKHNPVDPAGDHDIYPDDIGLIYLNEGDEIALPKSQEEIDLVNTVCVMPTNGYSYSHKAKVFVQGHGDKGKADDPDNYELTYALLVILDRAHCKIGTKHDFTPAKEFCYIDPTNENKRPCNGDSGAPLVHYENVTSGLKLDEGLSSRRAYAIGLHTNTDAHCGLSSKGYGRKVLYYMRWIEKTISSQGPYTCVIC